MKTALRLIVIVLLTGVYLAAFLAVLHPRVSASYRAFYIDRATTDYNSGHYPGTPERGIQFSRPGLPDWVQSTRGLSVREVGGRWTDADLGPAGLVFAQPISGDVCLDFTAGAVPWVLGQPIRIRIGNQEQPLQLRSGDPSEYYLYFAQLKNADQLEFILPKNLPSLTELDHKSADSRRLGLSLSTLRLLPNACPGPAKP